MWNRQLQEEQENRTLAHYSMLSCNSEGRSYPEPEHPFRTAFQRDRDRIIHSTAFRRLQYKTQVYITMEGDYYRTRLTHTLEVAQIARSLARMLQVNEDLTEAIALGHDLGHTPFGHAGEWVLDRLMSGDGGFEHNRQGLRVVDWLEDKYVAFPGLNLTREVREGILKHAVLENDSGNQRQQTTLEGQLVDMSDALAYNTHDLDDALQEGLLTLDDMKPIEIWQTRYERIIFNQPYISWNTARSMTIRMMINALVDDLVQETGRRLESYGISDSESIRRHPEKTAAFSPEMARQLKELQVFLTQRVYRHPLMKERNELAETILSCLFDKYLKHPDQIPETMTRRLVGVTRKRTVCDVIASMTDRLAQELYEVQITNKENRG